MSRILIIGTGAERGAQVADRLAAAGFEPLVVAVGEVVDEASEIDAVIVGGHPEKEAVCATIKRYGCASEWIPMIAEVTSPCASICIDGRFSGPNHYAIDDLLSPTLPQLLTTALAQHREIQRLRTEVAQQSSAIGLIMGGLFQVRTLTEARNLSTMLSLACPDPERIVVGLRELIVNAIEHGNLAITCEEKTALLLNGEWIAEVERRLMMPAYRDRRVMVQFRRETDRAIFQVRDEGVGFNFRDYLNFDPARLLAPNGRGIAMARSMSFDTLTYVGAGNDVIAISNFDLALADHKAA